MRRTLGWMTGGWCAIVLAGCGLGSGSLFGPDRPWPADGALAVLDSKTSARARPWLALSGVVHGDTLLVSDDLGLHRSTDSGATWSLEVAAPIVGIVSDSDGTRVVALDDRGRLHRSTDGGASWRQRDIAPALRELATWADPDSFYADALLGAPDLSQLVVVAYCEAFRSIDGGKSWSALPGRGGWDDDDHCLEGLLMDERFEPTLAVIQVSGTIASGSYVFEHRDGRWHKRCSFDVVGLLLKSVTYCGEIVEFQRNVALRAIADEIEVGFLEGVDPDDAVFVNGHWPIANPARHRHYPSLLVDVDSDRVWWFSYDGVAVTHDRGERWQTLAGGVSERAPRGRLADGSEIAVSDGRLFLRDGSVWRVIDAPEEVHWLTATPGGALLHGESSLWLMHAAGTAPERVWPSEDVGAIHVREATIWAPGSAFAASPDGGRSWQGSAVSESGLDWLCDARCVRVDWEGRVWHASLEDGVLVVREVARVPFTEGDAPDEQWFAADGSVWLLATYNQDDHDDDSRRYFVSYDRGLGWRGVSLDHDIEYFLAVGDGRALAIDHKENLLAFERGQPEGVRTVMELPGASWNLCRRDDGVLLISIEGRHPAHTDQTDFLLHSADDGATWRTQVWTPAYVGCP